MQNNLKAQRAIKDITQEELVLAVSVSRQTIKALEKAVLSAVPVIKIARFFELK